jgi:hypothetical protein
MKIISLILRTALEMFIDDEFLAAGLLAVIVGAALLTKFALPPLLVIGGLVVGCLAALALSVLKEANRDSSLRLPSKKPGRQSCSDGSEQGRGPGNAMDDCLTISSSNLAEEDERDQP